MKRFLFIFLPVLSLLTGCTTPNNNVSETTLHPDASEAEENTYEQITQIKAKEIMDSGEDYILLDVRTKEEFDDGHIEGAILIPDFEIEERAETELPDKDALILVYCRSGRRSKNAASILAALGYTNVKEFGGINNWAYGIVK